MSQRESLQDLSPARKLVLGCAVAGLGIVAALLIHFYPERLRLPACVAFVACAVFVIAGMAIASQAWLSPEAYARLMVLLLVLLTAIPAWIAFGPGPRRCTAAIPWLAAESGCRAVFALGTLILLGVVVAAIRHIRRAGASSASGPAGRKGERR
jgi:hypothetical protein